MQFCSPVKVVLDEPYLDALHRLIAGRSCLLVTSKGWVRRGLVELVSGKLGSTVEVIDSVGASPRLSEIFRVAATPFRAEAIVALGGGSVIDAAKCVAAIHALGSNAEGQLSTHLKESAPLPAQFAPVPIFAIPTTTGSGSEVTRWATVWGDDERKYSLEHPALYPEVAIVDPSLVATLPHEITLSSGLDALSHSLEAVWNKSHTIFSDALATAAIDLIVRNFPLALDSTTGPEGKIGMQTASLFAGIAMANTRTALAHSLSYPFTAELRLPHGLACSFTLAEVARYNLVTSEDRLKPIANGFGCLASELPERIDGFLKGLNLGSIILKYLQGDAIRKIKGPLMNPARADNNIRAVDLDTARAIVERAWSSITGNSSPRLLAVSRR